MLSSFGSLHSPSSAGGWFLGQIQSDSFDPCDQIVWCLQQWGLSFWEATKGNSYSLYCLAIANSPEQQFKRGSLTPDTGPLLASPWLWGRILSPRMISFHFSYIHMWTRTILTSYFLKLTHFAMHSCEKALSPHSSPFSRVVPTWRTNQIPQHHGTASKHIFPLLECKSEMQGLRHRLNLLLQVFLTVEIVK